MDVADFFNLIRTDARFPHAQRRTRPSSARRSILINQEIILNYLIAILAQKSEKIDCIELMSSFGQKRVLAEIQLKSATSFTGNKVTKILH